MNNWRVVARTYDPGFYGFCDEFEEIVADNLTKAEAKAIERHYYRRQMEEAEKGNTIWLDYTSYHVEVLQDGQWVDATQDWAYDAMARQEQWFEDMGWNYMNWQMSCPECKYDFKGERR